MKEVSLIDFVIEFNSTKIFKFLVLNNAKIEAQSTFNSIRNRNYEMIHIVESKNRTKFEEYVLVNAISSWNSEVVDYAIDNYNFDYLNEENIESFKDKELLDVINNVCYSINFQFLDSILIPFLQKNPNFMKLNIHEILIQSLEDQTGYFFREFLKYPDININYHSVCEKDKSILVKAINLNNLTAIKILLKNPKIDLKSPGFDYFLPFHFACGCNTFLEIIREFVDCNKLDINWTDPRRHFTAFDFCVVKGNFYALEYIMKKYPDFDEYISFSFISHCILKNYLLCAKLLLRRYKNQNKYLSDEDILNQMKNYDDDLIDAHVEKLNKILHELKIE